MTQVSREMPVGIGVKVLIPRFRDDGQIEYFVPRRTSNAHGRDYDLPGGRAEIEKDPNAMSAGKREVGEETGHDLEGGIVPIAVQRIDRSADREKDPRIKDVIRWTTIASPQEAWAPSSSDGEHTYGSGKIWRTRAEIAELETDDYLPEVVCDGGVLDKLEKSGAIKLGAAAVEKFIRLHELIG